MNNDFVEQYNNEIWKDSLVKRIVTRGDTSAYQALNSTYTLSGHEKEWCYYAFIMATNFDYSEAYFDLYILFRADSDSRLKTNKLANYYLLQAFEKGVQHTKSELGVRFGKGVDIPKAADYLKEIENGSVR